MLILLVEDDVKKMRELKKSLESETVRVFTAEDVPSAMVQLRKHRFDMVFSDVNLLFGSAYALVEKIRNDSDEALKKTPCYIYSSRATSDEYKELAMEVGANRFMDSTEVEDIKREAMSIIKSI